MNKVIQYQLKPIHSLGGPSTGFAAAVAGSILILPRGRPGIKQSAVYACETA